MGEGHLMLMRMMILGDKLKRNLKVNEDGKGEMSWPPRLMLIRMVNYC